MSHKTKVKAGGAMPPSVESIIREHSKARVITPSTKRFIVGAASDTPFGIPSFSRAIKDSDVKDALVRQYC